MKTVLHKKSSQSSPVRSKKPFFMKSGDMDSPSKNLRLVSNRPFFNHSGFDSFPGSIQPKLTIGQPGDKYEREADAVADRVMRMPDPQLQRQTSELDEEEMPMLKAQSPLMQMKCTECEKEEESLHRKPLAGNITPFFQRQEANGGEVNDRTVTSLKTGKSGGQPLSDDTRSWMENRFGTDFSHVRVHTDSNAIQMSRELNAQAFTYGRDIYFNRGKFNPKSSEGKHLLAHELTHTLQQQGTIRRQPEEQQNVVSSKPLLPGYTQCDFLNERITHQAQYALYHLYRRGGRDRQISLSILGAVKSNILQGIYKEDQGKPALMARTHEKYWWELIPKDKGAIVFEAEDPPMMIFQKHIANDRAALGDALRDAWDVSSLAEKAVIVPPPSLQPCPIVLDTVEIEGERCSPGMVWNPESESCECQPGLTWDPVNEICEFSFGIVKTECTDAEMAKEFQRQEDSCANLKMGLDILCNAPVADPCDLIGAGGMKGLPKSALPGLKNICKTLGISQEVCDEPRADFYERCIVSSIEGGKDSMPCYPGSRGRILEKYRRWPGREK